MAGAAAACRQPEYVRETGDFAVYSYFARQPILDRRSVIAGYELLYRKDAESQSFDPSVDANHATASVLDGFLSTGIAKLTGNKKGFVNLTEQLLLDGIATLFDNRYLVIEVLESVPPSDAVLAAVRRLREKGYMVALDDFVFEEKFLPLLPLANIIKIETKSIVRDHMHSVLRHIDLAKVRLLAEKVENQEQLQRALSFGFSLFQGYYFSRPVTIGKPVMNPSKLNYIQMMALVFEPVVDFFAVSRVVRRDLALSFRILRLVNSPYFGVCSKISDIHQAVTFLGERELKKWVSLVALSGLGGDKPDELVTMSIVRASVFEGLAMHLGKRVERETYFLMGLFSMIDSIMDSPMEDILRQLPLPEEVADALVRKNGLGHRFVELVEANEKGEWEKVRKISVALGLSPEVVADVFYQSVEWSGTLR